MKTTFFQPVSGPKSAVLLLPGRGIPATGEIRLHFLGEEHQVSGALPNRLRLGPVSTTCMVVHMNNSSLRRIFPITFRDGQTQNMVRSEGIQKGCFTAYSTLWLGVAVFGTNFLRFFFGAKIQYPVCNLQYVLTNYLKFDCLVPKTGLRF